ncbi:MAG: hypothetical protein V1755_05280 [Chloroflexota bacterium]
MKQYEVVLTLTEPLLGTVTLNKDLYRDYIASKAPEPEAADAELETIAELTEKGTTGFHRLEGIPAIYDYAVKGFFKDACSMLRRSSDGRSGKVAAYKKIVDGMIFVKPRLIPINVVGQIGILERPLRAQTAQGERVALSRSETVPAGSTLTFRLHLLDGVSIELIREWLDYGALRGLGQWRNAGWGTFVHTLTEVDA